MAAARAERLDEQNKRKTAAFIAKEVRQFWGSVEKLFEYRLKTQIDQKRKKALDEHLNMIVDRTEKYSTLLAESLAEVAPSTNTSVKTTPVGSDAESVSSAGGRFQDDVEYEPDMSSDDDERTIAKDDKEEEGELDMLNEEADIPVEELLKKFHPELYEKMQTEAKDDEEESQEKIEDEKAKSEEDSKEGNENSENKKEVSTRRRSTRNDEEAEDKSAKQSDSEDEEEKKDKDNLKALVDEDPDFFDAVETAEAFQPTGNTLATTTVKTKVPFLLKHNLREYQHIGLDWLVSLHERKFNGILADEMGLGKTIQTIAMLAHLACEKGVWGPHLIVVPTSVMLNWEMEIKKWCPAFKVKIGINHFCTE